ncbi:MAG: GIY-YIG nuclease family protein [Burkholderiales bacterium]|nr:GIY-YIG nuclease family protein [Burkholderiales bacterium]
MAYREDQTGPGFVYVLRTLNSANQNEIKVGLSIDPEQRRTQLSGTASAFPFLYERVWCVSNMAFAEDIAHKKLHEHRINQDREHFYIVPVHMLEGVFGSLWHEPSDDDLDCCLQTLLDLIEGMFTQALGPNSWYEVDCTQLPEYSRGRLAWKKRRPGAQPPEPLF